MMINRSLIGDDDYHAVTLKLNKQKKMFFQFQHIDFVEVKRNDQFSNYDAKLARINILFGIKKRYKMLEKLKKQKVNLFSIISTFFYLIFSPELDGV